MKCICGPVPTPPLITPSTTSSLHTCGECGGSYQGKPPLCPPTYVRTFSVQGLGEVTVNNYGAIEWDTKEGRRAVLHIDDLPAITSGARAAIALMRQEAV